MTTKIYLTLVSITLGMMLITFAAVGHENKKTETSTPIIQESDMAWDNGYYHQDQLIEGMTYRIWFKKQDSSQTGYCIFAVNLTKDKLEVELLKHRVDKKD